MCQFYTCYTNRDQDRSVTLLKPIDNYVVNNVNQLNLALVMHVYIFVG